MAKNQKEMLCPKCGEVAVFHKAVNYGADGYEFGKPIWECALCFHQVVRRGWENKHQTKGAL